VDDRLEASTRTPAGMEARFGLVLANIRAAELVPMAPALAARLRPGGALVLSGVLRDERRAVTEAYEAVGLRRVLTPVEHEWVALVLEHASGVPARGGRRS